MKIIEGDHETISVFKVYYNDDIYVKTTDESGISHFLLSPLEAFELGTLLLKLAKETDYFKGLKKDI